jgi:hypothetical protein
MKTIYKYAFGERILLDDGSDFFGDGVKVLERPYNSWEHVLYENKGMLILRTYWDMVPDWDDIRCDHYKIETK